MNARLIPLVAAISAAFVVAGIACTNDESNPPIDNTPDAHVDPADVGTADTSVPDTNVPDAADANVPNVTSLPFNTGVDNAGAAVADLQVDTHWTVTDASGASFTAYVQTDAKDYVGYWLAPSAVSKFISPFIDTVDPTGSGVFTYTTTFTLGDTVDVTKVSLNLGYASDNTMIGISLNGVAQPVIAAGYSQLEVQTATAPFVVGKNTISFTATNSGGPTGARVELSLAGL